MYTPPSFKIQNGTTQATFTAKSNSQQAAPAVMHSHKVVPQTRNASMPQQTSRRNASENQPYGYNSQPQNYPPVSQGQQTPQPKAEYLSRKIATRYTYKKAIDFNDHLVSSTFSDYANVHGCGGSNHAPNSTIGVVICDSTKGTGNNSVTVKYRIEARDIAILHQAAVHARLGLLKPDISQQTDYLNSIDNLLNRWKMIQPNADGSRTVPRKDLIAMDQIVKNALVTINATPGIPVFSYTREKNNPYAADASGYVPVSKIIINYSPISKDGTPSRYPWYICISNFSAPLIRKQNGATTHNSKAAKNFQTAFVNLSADDFASVMESISSYIQLWEMSRSLPIIQKALRYIDQMHNQNKEGK